MGHVVWRLGSAPLVAASNLHSMLLLGPVCERHKALSTTVPHGCPHCFARLLPLSYHIPC
jgi:hypothetical protein